MAFLDAPFRLALGNGEPRYYPAHVPIKDRADPGLRFELAQGQPWRWSGKDGPIEVELVDVLAAATLETLSGIQVLRGPILSMHALALVTALRNGDLDLAECLERQQAAVVDSIDEWQLGERKDGIDYVAHHVVTQRLLSIVGPFDFELVEIIRGDVAAAAPIPNGRSRRARAGTPALHNVAVGGVWRLTCEIDGRRVRIEEIGDVGDVHNWPHDGARLKDAASDALKRCAMRLGLGLHLWAQEHYFLDRQLWASLEQPGNAAEAEEAAARQPGPAGDGPAGPKPTAEPDAGDDPEAAASAPGAKRMPVSGTAEWEQPDEGLVERFDALVEAAGVSAADAREFLRGSPYYSGVSDPRNMHGPTLARLVERMGQEGAEGASGLAAFRGSD